MLRLESVTAADFEPHTETIFRLQAEDGAIALTLTKATRRGRDETQARPFSLLFSGPPQPALPQQIYRLSHETLGDMEIFLVPVSGDADQRCYEAIFA